VLRKVFAFFDENFTFIASLLLSVIGLITILGVTYKTATGEANYLFFTKQAMYLLIGIVAFFLISSTKFDALENLSPVLALFVIFFLFLVLVFGEIIYGSKRWISVGPFPFQPSEYAKPVSALFLGFLESRMQKPEKKFIYQVILVFYIFLISFLIFLEPDLGTMTVIVVPFFLSFFFSRAKGKDLLKISLFMIFLGLLFVLFVFFFSEKYFPFLSYIRIRMSDFFLGITRNEPHYNVKQGFRAIKSGGFFGIGLGFAEGSLLKFLPSKHTDFILAVIFEFFGFVGAAIVFLLYFLFLNKLFLIVKSVEIRSGAIASLFISIYITLQTLINIGVNLGLLPVTGITLPFLSYGGNSLVSLFISLGIVSSATKKKIYQTKNLDGLAKIIDEVGQENLDFME